MHQDDNVHSSLLLPAASENTHEFVLWVWMDVRFVCVDCVIRVPVCSRVAPCVSPVPCELWGCVSRLPPVSFYMYDTGTRIRHVTRQTRQPVYRCFG